MLCTADIPVMTLTAFVDVAALLPTHDGPNAPSVAYKNISTSFPSGCHSGAYASMKPKPFTSLLRGDRFINVWTGRVWAAPKFRKAISSRYLGPPPWPPINMAAPYCYQEGLRDPCYSENTWAAPHLRQIFSLQRHHETHPGLWYSPVGFGLILTSRYWKVFSVEFHEE